MNKYFKKVEASHLKLFPLHIISAKEKFFEDNKAIRGLNIESGKVNVVCKKYMNENYQTASFEKHISRMIQSFSVFKFE